MSADAPAVYIVFYSMHGHVEKLARTIAEGVKTSGCNAKLFRVAETLPEEVLAKMHAAPDDSDIPVVDVHDLPNADGIMFGIPTRFGMMSAQMKAMFDATGGLWGSGALVGKPAGLFFSTGTQGSGQETTAMTAVTQLAHHGMLYVPFGYVSPLRTKMDEIIGGSAWGSGTFAGLDGSRVPSETELALAEHHGRAFGETVRALTLGRRAVAGK